MDARTLRYLRRRWKRNRKAPIPTTQYGKSSSLDRLKNEQSVKILEFSDAEGELITNGATRGSSTVLNYQDITIGLPIGLQIF